MKEKELVKYLLLDFDNTVRQTISDPTPENPEDRRPPFKKEEVVLIEGIKKKLKEWDNKGWQIIGVSNQSGIEKGLVTKEQVEKVAAHTMDLLELYFPFYYAPYRRTGTKRQLSLRKPKVGMAIEAVNDWGPMDKDNSFMVGDYYTDAQFAENLEINYFDIKDFLNE